MNEWFHQFAIKVSEATGSLWASIGAFVLIVLWLIGGIFVGFENTLYQLLINTLTTIITFLMVFVIQHTANNDISAIQRKLDEIVRSIDKANDDVIGIERELDGKKTSDD